MLLTVLSWVLREHALVPHIPPQNDIKCAELQPEGNRCIKEKVRGLYWQTLFRRAEQPKSKEQSGSKWRDK
jgi:hypothetical protein